MGGHDRRGKHGVLHPGCFRRHLRYWSGASGTANLPPAGALVQVTGPLAAFNGLLEMEPVFGNSLESVSIISTGNPLPAAQPLPFDPLVTGYPATTKNATMNAMESMYFVAPT